MIVMWFVVGLLLFYVPRLAVVWADMDQELSSSQRVLLDLSTWIGGRGAGQLVPGIVYIFPMLLALTFGTVAWRIWAAISLRHRRVRCPDIRR